MITVALSDGPKTCRRLNLQSTCMCLKIKQTISHSTKIIQSQKPVMEFCDSIGRLPIHNKTTTFLVNMAASVLMMIKLWSYFPFDINTEFQFSCYKEDYSYCINKTFLITFNFL